MRHSFKSILAAAAISSTIILSGCSKGQSPVAQVQQAAGLPTMTATCNGTPVTFASITASLSSGRFTITGVLPAQNSSLQEVVLYTNLGATGTVTLNGASTTAGNTGMYGSGPSTSNLTQYWTDASNTGTMTITTFDATNKVMSGTFSFTAVQFYPNPAPGTVTVTSGTFSNLKW
jgi:hypothetical protein